MSAFDILEGITSEILIKDGWEYSEQWGNPQRRGQGAGHWNKFIKVKRKYGDSLLELIWFPETFTGYTNFWGFPNITEDVHYPKGQLTIISHDNRDTYQGICYTTKPDNLAELYALVENYKEFFKYE